MVYIIILITGFSPTEEELGLFVLLLDNVQAFSLLLVKKSGFTRCSNVENRRPFPVLIYKTILNYTEKNKYPAAFQWFSAYKCCMIT